ncbi:GNAT family N-acetyltransferase [Inhella gelatinilytica]|uniref:GNAT family N-acetyltransferase n=1 Tax=Inhella gelatinilytica TaxID=2795030 RepID=A0A931J0I5_9BURK|nr:GNAT family N-acetyltransferase [Inhella gelatinilytica]MBH9553156.1 GNAT family N-acetyltransferase [Inhella gelatinilytica]
MSPLTLHWTCQPFAQLTVHALYAALRLRAEVFILEQHCLYADVDGHDPQAQHLLGWQGETLVAYARLFAPGDKVSGAACIGRVVTAAPARGQGLGHELMRHAVAACSRLWPGQPMVLFAQAHLKGYYAAHGFAEVGPEFVEDGIPHVEMHRA